MAKGKVIHSSQVKPFVLGREYSSRMLLDDSVTGAETIQVNEGTLKGGAKTHGEKHKAAEIYYVLKGEAVLHLDQDQHDVRPGSIVFIPPGVFHSLDNKSDTEDFVILTMWADANENPVHLKRIQAWGKSFKTVDED